MKLPPALKETNFQLPDQKSFYRGKVRDVYDLGDKLAMVATDRISAFDVVLPRAIPCKGQVLNQIAAFHLNKTSDIVENWVINVPDPNVAIGHKCEALKVEMVVRGYLAGHAWREYKSGKRTLCGVSLPEGLQQNDRLPNPIITPTTKAAEGHDEDISKEEILSQGIVKKEIYEQLEKISLKLFSRGTDLAAKQGLILVDTKYEFGLFDGKIYLIDEIHTPDSSRFFYSEGYAERQEKRQAQKQLSKEFVREWLISNGFQGKEGQIIPEMTDEIVLDISLRYRELYEILTGEQFTVNEELNIEDRIRTNIINAL